jgi:hypothetical protein
MAVSIKDDEKTFLKRRVNFAFYFFRNDFSQLVADEYLKLFNFESLTLDAALRKFLKQFQLVGDAQEKERVLMYFAKRYVDANNTTFNDVGQCSYNLNASLYRRIVSFYFNFFSLPLSFYRQLSYTHLCSHAAQY